MIHAGDKHGEPVRKDCCMEWRETTASFSMCSLHTDYCLALQSIVNGSDSKRKSSRGGTEICQGITPVRAKSALNAALPKAPGTRLLPNVVVLWLQISLLMYYAPRSSAQSVCSIYEMHSSN